MEIKKKVVCRYHQEPAGSGDLGWIKFRAARKLVGARVRGLVSE